MIAMMSSSFGLGGDGRRFGREGGRWFRKDIRHIGEGFIVCTRELHKSITR